MKISSTYSQNIYNPNFKSTFPVAIWVRESNGSYAPIARRDIVGPLQERIISMLNNPLLTKTSAKQLKKSAKNKEISEHTATRRLTELMSEAAQKLRAYISGCDVDYRNAGGKQKVRSFYNNAGGNINNPYIVSYIVTGEHQRGINELGKGIGRANRRANEIKQKMLNELYQSYYQERDAGKITEERLEQYKQEANRIRSLVTEEQKSARRKYSDSGLNYVNYYPRRIKDNNGSTQVLHTKFEIIRDKDGKFVDYKFLDARFLPEFGPESPFEKLKKYIG